MANNAFTRTGEPRVHSRFEAVIVKGIAPVKSLAMARLPLKLALGRLVRNSGSMKDKIAAPTNA